jgi:hypothetical protein
MSLVPEGFEVEIRRITSQGPQTLEDFYRELVESRERVTERWLPQSMLDLLRELRADGPEPVVWGLTSLDRLGLHESDDWQSRSVVFIEPTSAGSWHIHCALPPDQCPWPEAVVTGYTEELAEALRRIRLGLEWAGLLVSPTEPEPIPEPYPSKK